MAKPTQGIRVPAEKTSAGDVVTLDLTDVTIIRELQSNARVSYRELSRKLGVSVTTVSGRVRRLVDLKVIRGFTAIINPDRLGPSYCAVFYVKVQSGWDPKIVAKELSEQPGICNVYLTVGLYDLVALGSAADKTEFSYLLSKVSAVKGVRDAVPSVILDVVKEDPKHPVRVTASTPSFYR